MSGTHPSSRSRNEPSSRVLVVVPAHNEAGTIAGVLEGLAAAAPEFDRVVVNDGSSDGTEGAVRERGERQIVLPCNLGYGLAVQTGLRFGIERGYDVIVTIDADGQHDPADVRRIAGAVLDGTSDVAIGSRFAPGRGYESPFGRRLGQVTFSVISGVLLGRRIYDTTSGFKAMSRAAAASVVAGSFLDFHIETIVRLQLLGFRVTELPIEVRERLGGVSMHSFATLVAYPLKTLILTLIAAIDAALARRRS